MEVKNSQIWKKIFNVLVATDADAIKGSIASSAKPNGIISFRLQQVNSEGIGTN